MALNDVMQLAVIGTCAGTRHVHTLNFKFISPTIAESDVLSDYNTNVLSAYRAIFSTSDTPAELLTGRQVCGTVPLRAPVELTPASALGTRNTAGVDRMPNYVAAVVSERSALAGRSYRGRFFIGGLWENDVAGNNLSTGGVFAAPAIDAYITALGRYIPPGAYNTNARLFVFSRKLAAVPGQQCQNAGAETTAFIRRAVVGTMRSRMPGHGT